MIIFFALNDEINQILCIASGICICLHIYHIHNSVNIPICITSGGWMTGTMEGDCPLVQLPGAGWGKVFWPVLQSHWNLSIMFQ